MRFSLPSCRQGLRRTETARGRAGGRSRSPLNLCNGGERKHGWRWRRHRETPSWSRVPEKTRPRFGRTPLPAMETNDKEIRPGIKEIRSPQLRLADGSRLEPRVFLNTLQAVRQGDFGARLPDDWTGLAGKIADTFN